MHMEHVMMALEHGKHVLVEKPMGMNASQVKIMMEKANEKKLFLMEGMWTRFLPIIQKVKEWIQQDVIGDVVSINADFGVNIPKTIGHRVWTLEMGGGALLDLGI